MRKSAKPLAGPAVTAGPAGRLVFERDGRQVWHDDCLAWLARCEPGRFSACVTDSPYELRFMGRKWDSSGVSFDPETWRAVLRALRPGAHLVAFGGTRTFHRIACAIEDGGFEIRDTLMWVYGQGFSKSLNVSKAIDKAAGAERKVVGLSVYSANRKIAHGSTTFIGQDEPSRLITAPATPEAARWQGWGTALKPSWEPIILARKPLDGTVAECVLRHGTGALNVDGCRIRTSDKLQKLEGSFSFSGSGGADTKGKKIRHINPGAGRWPPNAVFQHDARCLRVGVEPIPGPQRAAGSPGFGSGRKDGYEKGEGRVYRPGGEREVWACVPGCPVRMLDGQSGNVKAGGSRKPKHGATGQIFIHGGEHESYGDSGGASRFFYCPKANTSERRAGLSMLEDNAHPTVKPVALMEWLLRLVAPPGGEVLDPFAGSGSTLVAAKRLGVAAVGIDMDAEACETAAARLTRRTAKGLGGTKKLKLGKRRKRR